MGCRTARSPLGAKPKGMLRTPGRVPREAAPRNKCRVPWQRREFPGRGGRKLPPRSSRLGKQKPIPLPGEQNGRKATPRQGSRAPRKPRESLLFPGQRTASRRGLAGAEGAETGPALPPGGLGAGRSRPAQRSAAQRAPFPAAAAQPIAQTRGSSLRSRLGRRCRRPGGGLGRSGRPHGLNTPRTVPVPRPPLGPPWFRPQIWWPPQTGGEGSRGEAGAPSPFWLPLPLQQLLPNEPRNGDVQPTPSPSHTRRGQKTGKGGGGRAREAGAGSEAPERRELTCKQAVFLGSGLLDHNVDILLNSLLP